MSKAKTNWPLPTPPRSKLRLGTRLDVDQYTPDRTVAELPTNLFTKTAHGFSTGNQIKFPSTLPAIANDTNTVDKVFFVNKASEDTFTA